MRVVQAKLEEEETFIWLKFLLSLVWGIAAEGHGKENVATVGLETKARRRELD